ncbi:MAG: PAS domain-containing protein [Verrucomicrobia bacterium]|nr:PAS domain-containing protein [Verrucomicrobiota bacterium]
MNESPPAPAASPAACAVLVLDATGRVTAASASAGTLWSRPAAELIGQPFAALFVFEIVSSDPEFLEAQWEGLLITALDQDTTLSLATPEGAPREAAVRLEKNVAAAGYLASVQPPRPAAPATSGAGDDRTAAFQLLAAQGATGFFDLNLAAGAVHFSPAWKKIVGYAAAELPDTLDTWRQLIHPDDSAAAPDKPGKKLTPGPRPFSVEFRMKHRRGHWVWIQCVGVQVVSAAGQLERVVGLHLDVTERKQLEEESLANDARLQDLSGAGPLAAFELDFAGKSFWYSPAFETLLGHEEGELPRDASAFAAALPPDEASAGVEVWWLSRSPGQNEFVEAVKLRAKDGKPVPVLLGAHRSVTRKRDLSRVVGFACALPGNLTSGGAEGALPAELTNEAFATLAEAVIVADPRGKILFANAPAARLLRHPADQLPGQSVGDVFRLVNRQSGRPGDDPVDLAISTDQPLKLISSDALAAPIEGESPTPLVWTARASIAPDGKVRGVAIVFRNPDEMTLTPEELVKANRFESLGLLAGGIAHDFNNLLTTILGAVSIARGNTENPALLDAEKACDTAKGLTKQLLAFAKGGAGTQVACPVKEILQDSIKIAAAASSAVIDLDVPDGVEPVMVDRAQILQVFQNLIVNALQAMPPPPHQPRLQIRAGNIALTDDQVPSLPAGDYVELEVRDNGSGIKPEHIDKIFDPFFTTKKHGTGLGLATVLSIVRKHGGQLGLDTEIGKGTAFTVFLPKAAQPVEVKARRAASLRFGTGRVLFMDDDAKISALTATMLTSLDYKFDLAKNGEEAIAFYRRYLNIGRPYDVVIMDLTVVGGMGGEECFKLLKEMDPEVRAIVSTGYDNDDMNRKYMDMGWCGYLTKPYRAADLGKAIKTVAG